MAFLDTSDALSDNIKGGWAKFGTRRLFHYACDIIHKTSMVAPEDNMRYWQESKFFKMLVVAMKSRSSERLHDTRYILWKTDQQRFIRFDRLKVMIIGIKANSSLPTKLKIIEDTFDFTFLDKDVTGVDYFFRHLGTSGTAQLNDVLFRRIYDGIHSKFTERKNKNTPQWKEYLPNVKTKKGLNLGLLWSSQAKLGNAFQNYTKKTKKKEVEHPNKARWKYTAEDEIYLFIYAPEEEKKMKELLSMESHKAAIEYATKGYMTESFLEWLLQMRTFYKANYDKPKAGDLLRAHALI